MRLYVPDSIKYFCFYNLRRFKHIFPISEMKADKIFSSSSAGLFKLKSMLATRPGY